MYCHRWYKKRTYQCWAVKYPVSWGAVSGRQWRYVKLSAYQSPWYRICTKGMVISKENYVYGELTNVLPSSVQKTDLPVWGQKIPRFIGGGTRLRMEICEISCILIPKVPRLHQSNGYIKGKLRVLRAQKCIALVGAESMLTSVGPKNSPLLGGA